MATDIVCPHCKALLRLSVVDDSVKTELIEPPKKVDPKKTDDDILHDLIGGNDGDDDDKET